MVEYAMQPLRPGEYFQGEGQAWAEPDTAHAARLMREHFAHNGQHGSCQLDFSPAAVGAMRNDSTN